MSLTMKSIILLSAVLALRTSARPLIWEQPMIDIIKDQAPQPEDNPYGPMEVSAYYGNYYHPEGDNLHTDDLWPPLVPPRAVRRAVPAKVIYGPTQTPDILAPYRPICHRCPPGVVPLPVPSLARRDSPSGTSTEAAAAIATGAEQWQQYWAHDAAVSPVPTPTMATSVQSSTISTTLEATSLSTGAQKWQVYWEHDTTNAGLLTDKAKFDLFVKIFTVPRQLTTAIIALSEYLTHAHSDSMPQDQETQTPTHTVITMCEMIGQIFPQDKIQEELTEEMSAAINTTCKSLARLFPQATIHTRASTLYTENPIRIGGIALPSPDLDSPETHTKNVSISTHVSPSASAHRPPLVARGMYMFQPLEEAYTWLNDWFSRSIDQHPRWPYNYPEEHIFGCIYVPSWDTVAKDKIICPPGGRDGEKGVGARSYTETVPGVVERSSDADEIVDTVEDAVEIAVDTVIDIFEAFAIGKRSITDHPEPLQKRSLVDFSLLDFFIAWFGPDKKEEQTPASAENQNQSEDVAPSATEKRDVSTPVQKRNLITFLIWLFSPKPSEDQDQNENKEAATTAPEKRSISAARLQKRNLITWLIWLFSPKPDENQNQDQNNNTEATSPDAEKRSTATSPLEKRNLITFLIWLFTPKPKPETKQVSMAIEKRKRSEWSYAKSQWETKHLEVTDPETGEIIKASEEPKEPVAPIDPKEAYGPAPEWASADGEPLWPTGVAQPLKPTKADELCEQYEGFQKFFMFLAFGKCVTSSK